MIQTQEAKMHDQNNDGWMDESFFFFLFVGDYKNNT